MAKIHSPLLPSNSLHCSDAAKLIATFPSLPCSMECEYELRLGQQDVSK